MNYSICLLDEGGRAQRTAFEPSEDDAGALTPARAQVADSAIVVLWKGDHLFARLFRDPPAEELMQ